MNSRYVLRFVLTGLAAAFAAPVSAEVLYKLIDKNGKVTYSGDKPKNFDGQVIPLDIDPKANTATFPKPGATRTEESSRPRGDGGAAARNEAEARAAQARERLDAAKRALQEARDNPAEGDNQMIGNKGGGVRLIPSEAYQEKIARLEALVKQAEEDLALAEKGR